MVEQDKMAPVSTPQTTALDPAPATTPTPAVAKSARWLTREKKLAIVVLGSFIVLAAGVYTVKVVFKSKPPAEVAQTPPTEPQLEMPQQWTRQTGLEPTPAPTIIRAGGIEQVQVPELIELPPDPTIVLPKEKMKEGPIILPPDPVMKDPLVIDPPIVVSPTPTQRKDSFTNAKKNAAVKLELPDIDLPPILDDPPVAKNPVIRINGNAPKKEAGPTLEAPMIPDPPTSLDPPLIIDPPVTKGPAKKNPPDIDPPLVIDPPMTKKDPPSLDPPLVIDPPMTKKDPPSLDPPLVIDPPMTKKDPPTITIDLENPPRVAPKKADAPANSNEYDEDLHPFKKDENYRTISKNYYNSDAYALALQRYNREHPGQAEYVRVPPIWVLEKKYASDIASTSARSTSNAPPPSVDLTRNEQIYTVGDNGEMLADIAKKTMGSEDAWKRIWDMNSQLNPAKMIPGGTRLRLPNGARGE